MLFRFYYEEAGDHTHISVFAGRGTHALGKAGDLCLRNEEFQHLKRGIERTIGTLDGVGHDIEFINKREQANGKED